MNLENGKKIGFYNASDRAAWKRFTFVASGASLASNYENCWKKKKNGIHAFLKEQFAIILIGYKDRTIRKLLVLLIILVFLLTIFFKKLHELH